MLKSEILKIVQLNIEVRNQIEIKRKHIDDDSIACIPLAVGENLLLIQYLDDFILNGYKIIRLKDITSVRSEEIERFHDKILKEEGIYNQIQMPDITSLNNWRECMKELQKFNKNIIVEDENSEGYLFSIGKIVGVKNKLLFLNFDVLGDWDMSAREIRYKDIKTVSIDNRYCNILSKYISNT